MELIFSAFVPLTFCPEHPKETPVCMHKVTPLSKTACMHAPLALADLEGWREREREELEQWMNIITPGMFTTDIFLLWGDLVAYCIP